MIKEDKEKEGQATARILKALGHPARLMMAKGLMANECHVDKIVKSIGDIMIINKAAVPSYSSEEDDEE